MLFSLPTCQAWIILFKISMWAYSYVCLICHELREESCIVSPVILNLCVHFCHFIYFKILPRIQAHLGCISCYITHSNLVCGCIYLHIENGS